MVTADDVRKAVSALRTVSEGDMILADDIMKLKEAVVTLANYMRKFYFSKDYISRAIDEVSNIDVKTLDMITAEERNRITRSLLNLWNAMMLWELPASDSAVLVKESPFVAGEVYLLNTNDWAAAKDYIDDYTLVLMRSTIDTVTSDEILDYLNSYKVVMAISKDTESYHAVELPAFYNVIYTKLNPYCGDYGYNIVFDESLKKILEDRVWGTAWGFIHNSDWYSCERWGCFYMTPNIFDYFTSTDDKVPESVVWCQKIFWADYPPDQQPEDVKKHTFSYVWRGSGLVIEIPFDGYWRDTFAFDVYIRWFNSFIPVRKIVCIDSYTTGAPETHQYDTLDETIKEWCSSVGCIVHDLRS